MSESPFSKAIAATTTGASHDVPVTGYEYSPEDDGDTFVDHGVEQAAPIGGSSGGGVSHTATAAAMPGGKGNVGTAEANKAFSLPDYYANMSAALATKANRPTSNHSHSIPNGDVVGSGTNGQGGSPNPTLLGSGTAPFSGGYISNSTATPATIHNNNSSNNHGTATPLRASGGAANQRNARPSAGPLTPGTDSGSSPSPTPGGANAATSSGSTMVWHPSRLVSEFDVGKKKVRDMAVSPDGSRLFAAFADDPVCEMELNGTTLKHARSMHGVEQVHCMAVVRLPGVNQTTFTSVDAVGASRQGRKSKGKRRKAVKRTGASVSLERDFSSDGDEGDDDDNDGSCVGGAGGGKETYVLWCGVNRGNIEIMDLQNYSNVGTILNAHKQTVNKIWFLENGRVWSAGRDKALIVWDPLTRRSVKKRSIAAILSDLCYVSQTRQVWAIADDSYIRLYDAGGDNAALPDKPPNKTKNTIQMKHEMTLVEYNADMNLVWAGTAKSTALVDPETLKILQTLRVTLSSMTFHEKTAIVVGHGPWLERDGDCVAVLDITSPLQPSVMFSGACLASPIPQLGMRLFKKVPLGVVAYMGGDRLQDCILGVFVYNETKPFAKSGVTVLPDRSAHLSQQRTEFLGRRGVVKSHPVLSPIPPQQILLTPTAAASRRRNTAVSLVEHHSFSGTPALTTTAPSAVSMSRQGTSFLPPSPSTPGVGSTPGAHGGGVPTATAAATPGRPSPGTPAVVPGGGGGSGPAAITTALASVTSLVVGGGSSSFAGGPITVTAALSPEFQASLLQIDRKLEDMRAAVSSNARVGAPQSDFARLYVELSQWMSRGRGNTTKLSESETTRISNEYVTAEGRAAATAIAMLRQFAEEGVPPPSSATAAAADAANSSTGPSGTVGRSHSRHPEHQDAGGDGATTRRSTRGVSSAHGPGTGSRGEAATAASHVSPRSTWGGGMAAGVGAMSFFGEGKTESGTSEALLLGMLQNERRQLEALQRQNNRIHAKSEALANGIKLATRAISSLVEQVAMTAENCAKMMAREGAHRSDMSSLEERLEKLKKSISTLDADSSKVVMSTDISTKTVTRATGSLVECAENARGVVTALHTTLAYLQSSSSSSCFAAPMDGADSSVNNHDSHHNNNDRSCSSDCYVAELDHTGSHRSASAGPRRWRQLPSSGGTGSPPGDGAGGERRYAHSSLRGQQGNSVDTDTPLCSTGDKNGEEEANAEKRMSTTVAAAAFSFPEKEKEAEDKPALDDKGDSSFTDESTTVITAVPSDPQFTSTPPPPTSSALAAAPAKSYTVTVTTPRSLLSLLARTIADAENFVSYPIAKWEEKLTMHKLFPFSLYDGEGMSPPLLKDFIQCLSVWDLWLAEKMRVACEKELYLSLAEALLECRHNEGNCVRAIDGQFTAVPGLLDGTSAQSYGGSELYGSGGANRALPSRPQGPSQRVSKNSTTVLAATTTTTTTAIGEHENDFYFISGDGLASERKSTIDRLVMVSLHLESVVSRMRVSLSQLLSDIPEGVRRNPAALGFASMIRRWERAEEKEEGSGTVGRTPVRVYADKLRGTLYWGHLSVNFIAMTLHTIAQLLYRLDGEGTSSSPSPARSTSGGSNGNPHSEDGARDYATGDNYLFIAQKLTDMAFTLREEESTGAALAVTLVAFERFWRSNSSSNNNNNSGSDVFDPMTTVLPGDKGSDSSPHRSDSADRKATAMASITYEQGRSFYLFRSYLNIAVFRYLNEQSTDKAVELLFSSSAVAEEARTAVAAGGDMDRNRVGALSVHDAALEAREAAEARSAGDGGSGSEDSGLHLLIARVQSLAASCSLLQRKASALLAVTAILQERMTLLAEDTREKVVAAETIHAADTAVASVTLNSSDDEDRKGIYIPLLRETREDQGPAMSAEQHTKYKELYGVVMTSAVDEDGRHVLVPRIRLDDFMGY